MTHLTTTNGADQFYPTPADVAKTMLIGIDWHSIETILEPSAGKGDLVMAIVKAASAYSTRRHIDIDCIEIDPNLREILKYNFSHQRKLELRKQEGNYTAQMEADRIARTALHVIHDDFMTFRGGKRYDLIIMNPPFAQGDKHLLKALELQKNGGTIVCLLNAETILNPFSATRGLLKRELDKYGATVSIVSKAFSKATRKTDVEVAVVKITIPRKKQESAFFSRMEKAEEHRVDQGEAKDIVTGDYIAQAVQHYNVEVAATLAFIGEYHALKPYMNKEFEAGDNPILTLVVGRDSVYASFDINKYMAMVRLKYWRALFANKEFTGKLTSNLQEKYRETVEKMADYDFTMFNIGQVWAEMNLGMVEGVKDTILTLFDKLTYEHSHYPECQNKHYFNGWKTNKAHKIGKKSIIPSYGVYAKQWDNTKEYKVSEAFSMLSDIEKVFNYLDGSMTAEVDLMSAIAVSSGCTKGLLCKYFKVDIYKKGTTHITFTNADLVEKLNIYAAQNRGWLPPSYGKKKYSDMAAEETAVVDSFQGEKAYNRVLAMGTYFLQAPQNSMTVLGTIE